LPKSDYREIKKVAKALDERRHSMQDVKMDFGDLRRPIRGATHIPNPGRKISAVGLALIICPDPFSDVLGVPLFVLGELMNRRSPAVLKDIPLQMKRIHEEIRNLRS